MNKDTFNKNSVEEQVSIINGLISFNGSLRKACKDIGMNLSTVQNRFKKAGYVLKDGSYYKSVLSDNKIIEKVTKKMTEKIPDSREKFVHSVLNECIPGKDFIYKINVIRDKVSDIIKNFIVIGYYLNDIDYNRDYISKGYDNIIDFASKELSFSKTLTYNFMKVHKKFADGNYLKSGYIGFSFSQLVEMVSLPDEVLKEVKPETTVNQIRQKKKELKKSTAPESSVSKKEPGKVSETVHKSDVDDYFNMISKQLEKRGGDKYPYAFGMFEAIMNSVWSDSDKLKSLKDLITAVHKFDIKEN